MPERFVVHVGTPKSGTTYLQSVLWAGRERLLGAGVLLPGSRRFGHTRAAGEVVRGAARGSTPVLDRLLAEAEEHPGTVLLSDEWLVRAGPDAVAALVARCHPVPVEVVVTARTFTRLVPAAWQEELKLGRGGDLDGFVTSLDRPRAKWSWRHLDPVAVLQPWAAHLPAERLRVVVTPPSGSPPDLLWRRFAEAAGVPADAGVIDAVEANETLGVVAARLLQELGPDLRSAVVRADDDWRVAYRWLRRYVGHDVLQSLPRQPIALTPADHAAVRTRAEDAVRRLTGAGWPVLGDPGDLVGPAEPAGRHPATVTTEELLHAAGVLAGRVLADLRAAVEVEQP